MSDYITIDLSRQGKHKGKYKAIVSIEDADLAELRWVVLKVSNLLYAMRIPRLNGKKCKSVLIHRVILSRMLERQLLPTEYVDHIDGNGLNNRRENLRLVTHSQNMQNQRMQVNNTSGYKGVSWHKVRGMWRATIRVNNKNKHLGYFKTRELAYAAYCEAAIKYHGEFANLGIKGD